LNIEPEPLESVVPKDSLMPNSPEPGNVRTCLLYGVDHVELVILIEPVK
jgi:hypothetical protein